jgi:hypothetical protein
VEAAVAKLAGSSVSVSGVGEGQELNIVWPNVAPLAAQSAINKSELLPLVCALAPQAMISLVINQIERMASEPLPVAERPARIAQLEAEVERLQRIEEHLTARGGGEREANRPPPVVLGVRLVGEARGGKVAA